MYSRTNPVTLLLDFSEGTFEHFMTVSTNKEVINMYTKLHANLPRAEHPYVVEVIVLVSDNVLALMSTCMKFSQWDTLMIKHLWGVQSYSTGKINI